MIQIKSFKKMIRICKITQSYKSKTNYKNQCEMLFERTISSIERIIKQLWIELTDDETIFKKDISNLSIKYLFK